MEDDSTQILKKKNNKEASTKESFWELARFALIAIIIVIPVRIFIAQPFLVSGSSMLSTFENGDYLIVDEISYRFSEPHRGDIVIFRYPQDPSKFFIKRIIGLPGEKVEITNNQVVVFNDKNPNGLVLDEHYTSSFTSSNIEIDLNSQEYFVMGDNRAGSSDSRQWGPVNENLIIGRALLRLWPVGKIGIMPGDYKEELEY